MYPEDDIEVEAESDDSKNSEADETTSSPISPVDENHSDEAKDGIDKESESDNEFEQAFGSGDDTD